MPLHPSELFGDDQWKLDIGESEAKRLIETATRLPKDVTCVIDVGGGDGRFLESLVKTGYRGRAVLCDRSASGVRRSRFASVSCDSASLPFSDGSSDCVACCEVLEHLPDRMLESTVAELIRISSRYVLVTVPWNQQLARNHVLCPACAAIFHTDGHLRSFDVANLAQLFSSCRVLTLEVVLGGSDRYFSPALLSFKQRVLGLWADREFIRCPDCGFSAFGPPRRRLTRKLIGATNAMLNPRRRAGGWIFGLFEKVAPELR